MIKRKLIINPNEANQAEVHQDQLLDHAGPIVILGDPGIGKTVLCEELSSANGYVLVKAGKLIRAAYPFKLVSPGDKIIIDGLDEVTSSTPGDAVDEVLKKLSLLSNPSFVVSCRAADWLGAAYRHKINEDYGVGPDVFHLSPLTVEEATALLKSNFPDIDADEVIRTLQDRGVSEIYGNPLSLTLLGKAVRHSGKIPKTRAEILNQACRSMLIEMSDAHKVSDGANTLPDKLLDSAGAISAAVLLAGKTGLHTGPHGDTPDDYMNRVEIETLPNVDVLEATIRTRLFRSEGENCVVPIHRVVAEYLGARWLSLCLKQSKSPRRILQMLHFRGGVPTSLRGLNAWVAHFSESVAPEIIKADPYGILRYGDSDGLSLANAKVLLRALVKLSEEDPYFRSEDWGHHMAAAIARPELKDEILEILRNPNRPFHLSTLILNLIVGSKLVPEISKELQSIMMDESLYYGERSDAAESLKESSAEIDWQYILGELLQRGSANSARLTIRLLIDNIGEGTPVSVILNAILQATRLNISHIEDKEKRRISSLGSAELVPNVLPPNVLPELLDELEKFVKILFPSAGWERKSACTRVIAAAMDCIFKDDIKIDPARIWRWLKYLDRERSYSTNQEKSLIKYFAKEAALRRAIQKIALSDIDVGKNAWMRAHTLGNAGCGLYPTSDDFAAILAEMNLINDWTEEKLEFWEDLIRLARTTDGLPEPVKNAAKPAAMTNHRLKKFYADAVDSNVPQWKIKEEKRRKKHEKEKRKRFEKHRTQYLPEIAIMREGQIGILSSPARAYLGQYSDIDGNLSPYARLEEWLGPELAQAACDGFFAALSNDDLPSAEDIAKSHSENKYYYAETVMQCGIAEMLRRGHDIGNVPADVLMATLVSWQQFPEQDSKRLQVDIGAAIKPIILVDEQTIESFLTTLMSPQVAAGVDHISGLYQAARDDNYRKTAIKLAELWLRSFDSLPFNLECELVDIVLSHDSIEIKRSLVRDKLKQRGLTKDQRKLWLSAAFVVDFAKVKKKLAIAAAKDKSFIWWLRNRLKFETGSTSFTRSVEQSVFVVNNFGEKWSLVEYPGSSSGDTNPHDATDFIKGMIYTLSETPTEEASHALTELIKSGPKAYRDHMRHKANQQQKLLRDELYTPPTLQGIAASVKSEIPTSIDDLKAYTLDRLDDLGKYLRGSDVDSLDTFFTNAVQKLKKRETKEPFKPHGENYCRNRLIDFMRPIFPDEIQLLPETQMANLKRVDINIIIGPIGVPVEIKGQWHKEVWNAPNAQLDNLYTRDWRADGRGIYLVLWFGHVPYRNLPKHPEGLAKPKTPEELKHMLVDRISANRRANIDVYVLDLSKH